MELTELISIKGFSGMQKFELLEIVRRDNVVEGLLDYITLQNTRVLVAEESNENDEKVIDLKDEVSRLKDKLVFYIEKEQERQEEDDDEKKKQVLVASLKEFVEKFQKEFNRFPSIEEALEALVPVTNHRS